jgi:hypothetical protein
MQVEDKEAMFKEEDVKKVDSDDKNEGEGDEDKEDENGDAKDNNIAGEPPNPDEKKPEEKEPESEYEDVTDPEFDVFNSDDSTERKRIVKVNYK